MTHKQFAQLGWYIMESVVTNMRTVNTASDNADSDTLVASLAKLSACRILVVGDVMLDRYWFGRVDRISPEAPVPVVTMENTEERIGGAGNVACNIAALGGQCTLLSVVGDDVAGRTLLDIATQSNITPHFVVDPNEQTTLKLRVMSRNQQLLRVDFESSPSTPTVTATLKKFAELLAGHQVVILSDYGKGSISKIEKLIKLTAEQNLPIVVDPKNSNFSRYQGATILTPNLKEFESVVGTVADDADMQHKANHLLQQHGLEKLLVTMSERGMVLFSRNGDPIRCQSCAKAVYDVSGAGDTVVAVMALAMAAGLDQRIGVALASNAAGIVVSKLGTATATIEELTAAIKHNEGQELQ